MEKGGSRGVALALVGLLTFCGWSALAVEPEAEDDAAGRAGVPAPAWDEGDYWRYEFKQRPVSCSWEMTFEGIDPGTGRCDFTGTADMYMHVSVDSDPAGDHYLVNRVVEYWENGTYVYRPVGYQPSGPGNYRLHNRTETVEPISIRKADLATGTVNTSVTLAQDFTWTSYGMKWANATTMESSLVQPAGGGYIQRYAFPMDPGHIWQLSGTTVNHRSGTTWFEQDDGTTGQTTYDLNDTFAINSGLGTPGSQPVVQDTGAGVFDDCFKMEFSYFYNFYRKGTVTENGVEEPVDTAEYGLYNATTEWYSPRAGNIVNYNSTQSNNGLRLTSFRHIPVPPNDIPVPETVDGKLYSPDILVTVLEGERSRIEMSVIDQDWYDTLNWTVVSVVGAPANMQGARLMDEVPGFLLQEPTEGNLNGIHVNALLVTAKQPKTLASDLYTATINVDDGHEGGSVNFTFDILVVNVNSRPFVRSPPPDIALPENSTLTCATWNVLGMFGDPDSEAGIDDPLAFSAEVRDGPPLDISLDPATGVVTVSAPDYAPGRTPLESWNSTVRFTCRDSGSGAPAEALSCTADAVVHIGHVNHPPELSANGSDLEENGLTWTGDQNDTRLDLNKAFFDPDIYYAGDSLDFSWTGEKFIAVTNDRGRITLSPPMYWNGKECIRFNAYDRSGALRALRLNCVVRAVNHAPYFCESEMAITRDDKIYLAISEANSQTSANNRLELNISAKDPDNIYGNDPLKYSWSVKDKNGHAMPGSTGSGDDENDFEFRAAFTGAYSSEGSPYQVTVVVTDSGGLSVDYTWNVTVVDMNRWPAIVLSSPRDNGTYIKGRRVSFDASGSSDPDGGSENLTYIWNSSRQGTIHKGTGMAGARFNFSGLREGRHIITLTVMDSSGGQYSTALVVNIRPEDGVPGFGGGLLVAAVAIAMVLVEYRRRK